MQKKKIKNFVWIESNGSPVPQVWHEDGGKDGQGKVKPTLKSVELQEDDPRSLDELVRDYPL